MTMELRDISQSAITCYQVTDVLVIPAGQHLKIQTTGPGDDLNVKVPAGKTWRVVVNLTIREE